MLFEEGERRVEARLRLVAVGRLIVLARDVVRIKSGGMDQCQVLKNGAQRD